MLNVAVLISASGTGSNLQALITACATAGFPAQIVCVISNKEEAKGLERARRANIPTFVIPHKNYSDRQSFEEAVHTKLEEHHVQLVCLAGFMRILTAWFVDRWRDRLLNIHPSLLPSFPGEGAVVHQNVIDYGAKLSGCTIHFVRTEMDHGPIVLQAAVPVFPEDTVTTLAARVQKAEHRAYPAALRLIAENKVNVFNERTFITDAKVEEDVLFNPSV